MPSPQLVGFEHRVIVGIADLAVTNNRSATLTTYSLGSCLAVAIYDPVIRCGGLLHAMLPDSSIDPVKAAKQPGMFIETGVAALFRAAYQFGAEKMRMRIAVAGGGQIMDNSGFFNIGKRNYEALMALFQKHGLRVAAEQVGGLVNRTVYLNVASGEVRLKVSGQASETVLLCGI
ncbi:MAG: chemotaxis protein CheD [Verrucomicrobiales bacterium]|jgi:chemotaxis protein CheD|nr:chemotaxis protein CheD [Verrucomicrobiales bacterium]